VTDDIQIDNTTVLYVSIGGIIDFTDGMAPNNDDDDNNNYNNNNGVGRVADQAANMKSAKYADFTTSYTFQPIAVENLGPINSSFLNNLNKEFAQFLATIEKLCFYSSEFL